MTPLAPEHRTLTVTGGHDDRSCLTGSITAWYLLILFMSSQGCWGRAGLLTGAKREAELCSGKMSVRRKHFSASSCGGKGSELNTTNAIAPAVGQGEDGFKQESIKMLWFALVSA